MTVLPESHADGYETVYRDFDSPLMRQIWREAYCEDIGQHSGVSAEEVRADIRRLALTPAGRSLDLGCGPCGPLAFVVAELGCHGTGIEISRSALQVGRGRAAALGIESLPSIQQGDLNEALPFVATTFDAAVAIDVVLHFRNRAEFFQHVRRLLSNGGRFLITDAGAVTGGLTNEEIRRRSVHGHTQFVAPRWNERLIFNAGPRLIEYEDRTISSLTVALARLGALLAHRVELEGLSGAAAVAAQQEYLEVVVDLSQRKALSRVMYLAEVEATTPVSVADE